MGRAAGSAAEAEAVEAADGRPRATLTVWVFGYGSLMVDGWEEEFGGTRHEGARLVGYHRSFNKRSTENWGTPERPGITLGLERDPEAVCVGCAFHFPDERADEIRRYLRRREGPAFSFPELEVMLPDERRVRALVAVNDTSAPSYVGHLPVEERAGLVEGARGSSGSARRYLTSVREMLRRLGIRDPHVEELWDAVREADAGSSA